ncbi:MAG: hypothetical protein JSS10_07540 [Verrucomicrobia bacterium]|nr:hypothetical protein [Verrucomicrobiota bacterium]
MQISPTHIPFNKIRSETFVKNEIAVDPYDLDVEVKKEASKDQSGAVNHSDTQGCTVSCETCGCTVSCDTCGCTG